MKANLEVIEPLSPAEAQEFKRLEAVIGKTQKHVNEWLEAVREIRDGRLYREHFKTWADYCAEKFKKSVRAVQMALQLDDVRRDVAQSSAHRRDQQTKAIAQGASENVLSKLSRVPKSKRVAVLKLAAAATRGKPTGAAIEKAAAQISHTKIPPKQAPRGGFAAAGASTKIDSSIYSSGAAVKPQKQIEVTRADLEASRTKPAVEPVTDSASAVARMEFIYERDKAWFNSLPMRTPRAIVEKLIEGMRE